jgi:hypothetical protein
MSNISVLVLFAIIAIIIFFFLSKDKDEKLSQEDIDKINKGIKDINSDYYEEMPSGKRIRYETVIDLILMNLDSSNKKTILENPSNLESAIHLLAYAADASPDDPDFRQKQIERIESESSYVFPELGRDKCPPPPPPPASKAAILKAPYWVWTLNRIYNHLLGYRTEVRGFLDDEFEIKPSTENKFYTQFDKPEDLHEEISKFTWKVKLINTKTGEISDFDYVVFFQN